MGNGRGRWKLVTPVALAAGLLLRLWFVRHAPLVDGDGLVYGGIAENWLIRGVYGFYSDGAGGISPTLIRLPGYPMFLAACFKLFGMQRYEAVRYVQVAFDLVTCGLCGAIARRLLGHRAGVAVFCLAALCPFTANYAAAPLTETLVLLAMSATFYGYLRWIEAGAAFNPWLWLIGSSLAYSLLLRPEQVLLSVAILPAMWWVQRRSHRSLAPIAVCAALVMLPLVAWTARNWRTFHVLQPLAPRYANDPGETPPLGFARWYRTWAVEFSSTDEVYWNYNSGPIDPAMLPERAFDSATSSETEHIRQRTLGVLHQYNQTGLQSTESEAGFRALAEQRVQAHPTRYYILLPLGRLADMILRPRTEMMAVPLEWWRWREHPQITLRAAAYAALNFLYLGVGAAGFWKWRRSGFSPQPALVWAMLATVLLRCALLLTVDNSEPRYTLEFFPILFIGAGALFARGNSDETPPTPESLT